MVKATKAQMPKAKMSKSFSDERIQVMWKLFLRIND